MRYSEAGLGRIFVLRLEDGDRIPETIEDFALGKNLQRALCLMLGGLQSGSRLVTGPEDGDVMPPEKILTILDGVHETAAVGTLFPDETGKPSLHMHAACGRGESTKTGCVRPGVVTWKILEVVLLELTGTSALRRPDPEIGFPLLSP